MSRLAKSAARLLALALCCFYIPASGFADGAARHVLWEVRGKHNTLYILGSIHVLRSSDYPLAPAVLDAYAKSHALFMEVNLQEIDSAEVQSEMLSSAMLPDGTSLPQVLGKQRYEHAAALAHDVGTDLGMFDQFAPWFAAEAISQLQLAQLGFDAQSGVEMYFLERARKDGKGVAGLETVHEQIALFQGMSLEDQADYLVSSLEQAHDLPQEVNGMVHAWQSGDTDWFVRQLKSEFGRDPHLYDSLLVARNRKWLPKIEALLREDQNYLVIVGAGHLVGQGSVIELLQKDGIGATQL